MKKARSRHINLEGDNADADAKADTATACFVVEGRRPRMLDRGWETPARGSRRPVIP